MATVTKQTKTSAPGNGSLPAGWRRMRFDAMAENVNDRVDDPAEAGVEYYVGLEHLDPESLKIRRWGKPTDVEATKLRFKPGDIIFGRRRAYQRKLAVAEFEGICSAHAMVLRARPEVVLPEFLPFFMQSDVFFERAMSISVGSLSPTINWKTLAQQEFALPPRDEQRRIAEILWAADKVTQEYQKVLQSLNELKNSVSLKLFDEKDCDEETKTCAELCEEITVGIVVEPSKYYTNSGVLALRSLNVFPGRFLLDDIVYISQEAHNLHQKSRIRAGNVVVVRSGRPGDAAVVSQELDNINCIDLIIARPGKMLRPNYLSRFLNSAAGRRQLYRGTAGTAQKHFNIGEMKKMKIPALSLYQQDDIVAELDAIDTQLQYTDQHIEAQAHLLRILREQLLNI
jgi:type I restriction enzyme, S subunit